MRGRPEKPLALEPIVTRGSRFAPMLDKLATVLNIVQEEIVEIGHLHAIDDPRGVGCDDMDCISMWLAYTYFEQQYEELKQAEERFGFSHLN